MGVVLAAMNACFYVSIDRLPLGTVAAIEFLPVIALAAVGMRTARNAVALGSAVAGVYLLTDVRIEGEPVGVAFAFANAGLFALYIVLAHRIARDDRMSGIDGLGAAMLVAMLAITPIGIWSAAPALVDPIALAAGIGVGITSSVIPYVFDQLAMARLSRATYSLMVSLLPATATVVGIVVLAQIPSSIRTRRRRARGFGGRRAPRNQQVMEYVRLGSSGLKVSRICLGMMSYGDPASRAWHLGEPEAGQYRAARSRERGNFFDTADMYSEGMSEEIPAACSQPLPEPGRLCARDKGPYADGTGPNDEGFPQAGPRRHRRVAETPQNRVRRPVPDPSLGPRNADRRDHGGPPSW